MHSIFHDFQMYRRHYILSYEMKCIVDGLSYVCSKKCDLKETCRSEREPENSTFPGNMNRLVHPVACPLGNLNCVVVASSHASSQRVFKNYLHQNLEEES